MDTYRSACFVASLCLLFLLSLSGTTNAFTSYAALGDSYAAGDGSGSPLEDVSYVCGRFSHAYPVLVANKLGLTADDERFRNVACGAARTWSILLGQLAQIKDSELVTITIGGNDVDFFQVVNDCVYKWWPGKGCEAQLTNTRMKIESSSFIDSYDRLIKVAVRSLAPGAQLLVTGYPRFFNDQTSQCDNATFSNEDPKNYLTKELRAKMNVLLVMLNDVIKATSETHGATYVDIDSIFDGHRFCEEGVQEPVVRPETWFFGSNTRSRSPNMHDSKQSILSAGPWRDTLELLKVFHPTEAGHEAISNEILRVATESG